MRRRQVNQMRAATAPDEAHPTSPVEQSQQAPAVSVPPAPPGPPACLGPLDRAQVQAWGDKLAAQDAWEFQTFSARVTAVNPPKRKPGRPRKVSNG